MSAHTYSAGTAFLTVVPSFLGVERAMADQVKKMAEKVDKTVAAALPKGMAEGAKQARGIGERAADEFGGAYEARIKKFLTQAYKGLPKYEPEINLTPWQQGVKKLREDLKELTDEKFGPDLDERTFATAVERMRRSLRDLLSTAPVGAGGARGIFDLAQTDQALAGLDQFVGLAGKKGEEAADALGGQFAQRLTSALGKGVGAVPRVEIGADTSEAERKLQGLRDDMVALSGQTIGVEIDAVEAYAEVRRIQRELATLQGSAVDIEVRTNARAASNEMVAFIQQVERAPAAIEQIGTTSNFSMTRLGYLIGIGASLGSVIVPSAAAAAAAIGSIGTMAAAGGLGLGVFALGLSGISDAVKSMNTLANDQAKSANSINQSQRQLAGSADQVRMAELALANTRANIADQEFDAAQRVADAQRSVADARRDVASAEAKVNQARRDAKWTLERDNREVKAAQQSLTAAEADALDVRSKLNQAIKDATKSIEDLDIALGRNRVDEQKAVTAQMKALAEYQALRANPRSTEVELRQAKDAYDEQTQRIRELGAERKKIQAQQVDYAKKGVAGDEKVIAARKRIKDADAAVAKARERVDVQQRERLRNQEESARKILAARQAVEDTERRVADAQRGVADARRAQARQERQGQYQLATAINSVESAQRSAAQATEQAGVAGGAALDNYRTKMEQLSPAGRDFAKFIFGLKDEAISLRNVAQEGLLPGLQEAITDLLPYLPGFERFVGKIAEKLGSLAQEAVAALGSPTWQRFFSYIDAEAVPALDQMWHITDNFAQGLINLFLALTPFNRDIGGGLLKLSEDFARWAETLDKKQGYQEFLEYVRENGPKVVHFLGEIGLLFIDLVQALAPIGEVVLPILNGFIDAINSVPIPVLTGLLSGIAVMATLLVGLGAVMKVVRLKRDLTDIFGPRMTRMVDTYAVATGRATTETGRFQKVVQTAAGFTQTQAQRFSFLGTAATNAQVGVRLLADETRGNLQRGLSAAGGAVQTFGGRMQVMGERTQGARNYLTYLSQDLARGRLAPNLGITGTAAGGAGRAFQSLGGHVQYARNYLSYLADDLTRGPLGPQFAAASTAVTGFGGKVRDVGTRAITGMRNAASGLSAFLGGPWGVALAGATVVVGALAAESAEYNGKIATLNTTLGELGTKYRELKDQGKLGSAEAADMLLAIAQSNPDMQQAVINLDQMGIKVSDLGRAAAGSKEDVNSILSALDSEIDAAGDKWRDESNFLFTFWSKDARQASTRLEQLRQLREAVKQHADEVQRAEKVEGLMNKQSQRTIAMGEIVKNNTGATKTELAGLATQWDANQIKLAALNTTLGNFGDDASSAARRADDLTAAIERQYGAAINANEAAEKWSGTLQSLRDSVASNGRTLDINSRSGLANRDALQAAALASRNMFIEEVKLGGKLPEVTAKHNDRIAKLREEARRLGLTKGETDKLIKAYGEIDPAITTKYTTAGFDKVFMEAQKLRFAQYLLEQGITDPKEAQSLWKQSLQANQRAINMGGSPVAVWAPQAKATGGQIDGVGTGTSDSNLIWASKGEHMLTAKEVAVAGGHEAIYAWRKQLLAGGAIPEVGIARHAVGGAIGEPWPQRLAKGGAVAPFPVDLTMTKLPTLKQIREGYGGLAGGLGAGGGGMGWRWQMEVLRRAFPGLALFSGPRPDSRTASGGLSWHARPNSKGEIGRAVDVPPRMDVFRFIRSRYGANSKELIWGGAPDQNVWHGKPHRFSESLLRQHGPYKGQDGPSPHIHWAFDSGGWLEPGMTGVNYLRQPEPVLTPGQWGVVEDFVKQGLVGGARGNTYNFEFANSTLDESRLRAIQMRDEAVNRVGRPI